MDNDIHEMSWHYGNLAFHMDIFTGLNWIWPAVFFYLMTLRTAD